MLETSVTYSYADDDIVEIFTCTSVSNQRKELQNELEPIKCQK